MKGIVKNIAGEKVYPFSLNIGYLNLSLYTFQPYGL